MASARKVGTNETVHTFDPGGGADYTLLSTWEADTDIDLVTDGSSRGLKVISSTIEDQTVDMAGATTDATHFRRIFVDDAVRHHGTPTGPRFFHTGNGDAFRITEDYSQFQDIVASIHQNTSSAGSTFKLDGGEAACIGCISVEALNDSTGSTHGFRISPGGSDLTYCVDCISIDARNNGFAQGSGTAPSKVYNCLAVDSGNEDFGGSQDCINCISQGGSAGYEGTINSVTDCIAQDTSGDIQATLTFVNPGANDYHLDPSDTAAIGAGTDLSSDASYPFDDDADHILFNPGAWDIGPLAFTGVITPSPVAMPLVIPVPQINAQVRPDPVTLPLVIPAPQINAQVRPDPVVMPLVLPPSTIQTDEPFVFDQNENTNYFTPIVFDVLADAVPGLDPIDVATVDLDPAMSERQTTFVNTGEGTFTVDDSGNVTFTPDAGFEAASVCSFTVQDTQGRTSNTATITVTVAAAVHPTVQNQAGSTPGLTPIVIDVLADATPGSVAIDPATLDLDPGTGGRQTTFVNAGEGTFTCDDAGNVTFTPDGAFEGVSSASFTVEDIHGNVSNTATIDITVQVAPPQTNNHGVATPYFTAVQEDVLSDAVAGSNPIDVATVDLDPATTGRQTTVVVDDEGTYTVDDFGVVTFTPVANFSGQSQIPWTVDDDLGNTSDTKLLIVNVQAAIPTLAINDVASTLVNVNVQFNVLNNDLAGSRPMDAATLDLDPATAGRQTTFIDTGKGTFTCDDVGNVTFAPDTDYTGPASCTYTVEDDHGYVSNEATISITVGDFDAPLVQNQAAATDYFIPVVRNVLADATEGSNPIDPATLDLDPVTGGRQTTFVDTGKGTYTCDDAGNVTFTPDANFDGVSSVSFAVEDDQANVSNTATFSVTVAPAIPPTTYDDFRTTAPNTPRTLFVWQNDVEQSRPFDVASVDLDPDTGGQQTTFIDTGKGTFTVDAFGELTFTPDTNFVGTAQCRYTIADDHGNVSAVATISMTVVLPAGISLDLGAVTTRNRRQPEVFLIDIETPGTFDYFRLIDSNAITWYYWMGADGTLVSALAPPDITIGRGLRPNDVTPSDNPTYIEIAGGTRWLVPDVFDGTLTVLTTEPVSGTVWDVGTELAMYTLEPGTQSAIQVDTYDTIVYDVPAVPLPDRDDTHSRFCTGSLTPYFLGFLWQPRVVDGYTLTSRIGDATPFAGRVTTGIGSLRLARGQSGIPNLEASDCVGCPIRVIRHSRNDRTIQAGKIHRITHSYSEVNIVMTDGLDALRQPIQRNRYEGTADVSTGGVKPLTFGYVRNIRPVLRDARLGIRQYHDGQARGVQAARVGGVTLPKIGTVSTLGLPSLSAWQPGDVVGFLDDPIRGECRVNPPMPDRDITLDVIGDARRRAPQTTAGIVAMIGALYAGNLTLDDRAFNNINDPARIGIYIDSEATIEQVLDDLVRPVQAYYGFGPAGRFTMSEIRFRDPAAVIRQSQIVGLPAPLELEIPVWEVIAEWGRNYTVQTDRDLALATPPAVRQFVERDARSVRVSNLALRQQYNDVAITLNIGGFFQREVDARIAAQRVLNLRGRWRRAWELETAGCPFELRAGQTVTINAPDYGLSGDYIVTRVTDRTDTLVTGLRVWG